MTHLHMRIEIVKVRLATKLFSLYFQTEMYFLLVQYVTQLPNVDYGTGLLHYLIIDRPSCYQRNRYRK